MSGCNGTLNNHTSEEPYTFGTILCPACEKGKHDECEFYCECAHKICAS